MEQNHIELTLALVIQLQAVNETLDEITDKVVFKREMKMKINNFQAYLDKFLDTYGKHIGQGSKFKSKEEHEKVLADYVQAVKEFSDLRKQIKIS
jgi:hypothetical protein